MRFIKKSIYPDIQYFYDKEKFNWASGNKAFFNQERKIEELVIQRINPRIIKECENSLQRLTIKEPEQQDIKLLKKAKLLRELNIWNGDKTIVASILPITNSTELISLSCRNIAFKNFGSISRLKKLEYLSLEQCNISDISCLAESNKLKRLHLFNNEILSLDRLKDLENLEYLDISRNNIMSLSGIEQMSKIKTFYCSRCSIRDISEISNLRHCKRISLSNNNITNIIPLENLIELENIDLSNNSIKDLSPLKNKINLTGFDGHKNKIDDITPLKESPLNGKISKGINFLENPIKDLPEEILNWSWDELALSRNHYNGSRPLFISRKYLTNELNHVWDRTSFGEFLARKRTT